MTTDRALRPPAALSPPRSGLGRIGLPQQVDESNWQVEFDPAWRSFPTNMHGGVVLGTLAGVARATVDRWPTAVAAHLQAAVRPGRAELRVRGNRRGRTATSADVRLVQGDLRATALVELTADRLGAAIRTWPDPATVAALSGPAPESLDPVQLPTELALMAQQLDIRPTGASRPLAGGGAPELSAWVRLRPHRAGAAHGTGEGHRLDLAAMLLDVLPPALYATLTVPVAIPTIELTAHFPPVETLSEWFHVRQWTSWATDALCVDSSEVWDADGRLVGESRQLRRIVTG